MLKVLPARGNKIASLSTMINEQREPAEYVAFNNDTGSATDMPQGQRQPGNNDGFAHAKHVTQMSAGHIKVLHEHAAPFGPNVIIIDTRELIKDIYGVQREKRKSTKEMDEPKAARDMELWNPERAASSRVLPETYETICAYYINPQRQQPAVSPTQTARKGS
jgi:hypothetical protein